MEFLAVSFVVDMSYAAMQSSICLLTSMELLLFYQTAAYCTCILMI